MQTIKLGRYQHFRGGFYQVHGLVHNEADPEEVEVLYQSEKDGKFWRRKIEKFTDMVDPVKYGLTVSVQRYKKVEDLATSRIVSADDGAAAMIINLLKRIPEVPMSGFPVMLVACERDRFYYQFRDFVDDKLYVIDDVVRATQGFLSFAQSVNTGRLIGLGLTALSVPEAYDAYALSVLIQFIVFGRLVYA